MPGFTARSQILAALGVETAEQEFGGQVVGTFVPADPTGATAVPGVWVAGNVADLMAQVIGAAAAGVRAAAAVNADLIAEEVRDAVAAHHREGSAEQFWESFYGEHERVWSGRANPVLVRAAGQLAPGTALDLGCGEGADAIWLAQRGWRVTAVDISATALDRAAAHATSAGVGDRIDWRQHDLARTFPPGTYDLVTAQYLHSPVELPREQVLKAAAEAVAPGGLLLAVGHAGFPPWAEDPHPGAHFPTPQEVLTSLDLPPTQWRTELLETPVRTATGPDGQTATLTDSVMAVRRLTAEGR